MNEKIQRQIFNILKKKGIKNFVGVPDSTMKHFIDEGLKKEKILITTREEEAIGIAAGMSMSNEKSLVFMQNAGFANSLSTITSLIKLYEIPMILLIGWRGFLKDDAPEHEKIAKVAKFKTYKISTKEQIKKIFSKIKKENGPICILVKIEKSSVRSIRVDITPPNIKTRFMKSLK